MAQTQTTTPTQLEMELALERTAVAGMNAVIEVVQLPEDVKTKIIEATIALQTQVRREEAKIDGWG